jgi:type III secretion protein Q
LLPLRRPLDEPLDIMANGRRLGRGTLVQIGESLGVRIVSIAGNE